MFIFKLRKNRFICPIFSNEMIRGFRWLASSPLGELSSWNHPSMDPYGMLYPSSWHIVWGSRKTMMSRTFPSHPRSVAARICRKLGGSKGGNPTMNDLMKHEGHVSHTGMCDSFWFVDSWSVWLFVDHCSHSLSLSLSLNWTLNILEHMSLFLFINIYIHMRIYA